MTQRAFKVSISKGGETLGENALCANSERAALIEGMKLFLDKDWKGASFEVREDGVATGPESVLFAVVVS